MVKNDKKPKDAVSVKVDDSDTGTVDGRKHEKKAATISEASTLSLDEEGFEEDGWETVKSRRSAKEAVPSRRQWLVNAKERQAPLPANVDKPVSSAIPKKTVATPAERTQLSSEQTKYRQALLKPVAPPVRSVLDKVTVATASTASDTFSGAKRPMEAKTSVSKPQPEILLPKDIDDLSEFPALAVKKGTASGKSAGTLRIVTQPQTPLSISGAGTPRSPPAQRSIANTRPPNEIQKPLKSDLPKPVAPVKPLASESNVRPGSSDDHPKKTPQVQTKKRAVPGTSEKKKIPPQQSQNHGDDRQPSKSPSVSSTPQKLPSTTKAISEPREVISKEKPKLSVVNTEKTLSVQAEKNIASVKEVEEPIAVGKPIKAPDSTGATGPKMIKSTQKEPKSSEEKLVQTQKPMEESSTTRANKLDVGSPSEFDNVAQAKRDQTQKEENSVPKEADPAAPVNKPVEDPKTVLVSKITPVQEVAIPVQAPIKFGCLIVEPSGTSIVNATRSVRWGDSEVESEEEQMDTKIDACSQANAGKLPQEAVVDTVANKAEAEPLDDETRKFLQKYYAAPLSNSNTTAKPGPITPIKTSFRSRGTSTSASSWPIGVDEPAVTAVYSEVVPKPVDIQITVSEPPTSDNQPFESSSAAIDQAEAMDTRHVQALDGTADGGKLSDGLHGARNIPVKDSNTLQLPEPTPTMPAGTYGNENVTHGVYPEIVSSAPAQQYNPTTTDPALAPVCLRTHVFTCPNCEKQIRHRASILCPGCGPDADVRFCSNACLFGTHGHWEHCGTLAFNRPVEGGILMHYEAMPVSKTEWTSFELWRQALYIWDDENIDYFIFSTETNELIGKLFFSVDEYERFRFRELRDACIQFQDNDQVSLLFRALWHQCQYQGVEITKIELRHLLALEYGQDIPSVYIPKISDYEWAYAGYVLAGYDPHQQAYQNPGYYAGHGYLPYFG